MLSLGFDEKTQDPIFQTNHIQNKKSKNFASVFKAMNSLIVSLEMKLDSDIPATDNPLGSYLGFRSLIQWRALHLPTMTLQGVEYM